MLLRQLLQVFKSHFRLRRTSPTTTTAPIIAHRSLSENNLMNLINYSTIAGNKKQQAEIAQTNENEDGITECDFPNPTILPLTITGNASTSSHLVPEYMKRSQENSCALSLGQLLTSSKSPLLHRPTPIHPITSNLCSLDTKALIPETSVEMPLDLSQSTFRNQSVIINPQKYQQQQQPKCLPTCANPNLNSNWIAIKFGAATGPNRMSYPREFKLMVINYYYTNGQNKYRTCKEFQITKSMLNGWLQKIDKIQRSRPGSLKSGRSGRKPQFPDIEKQLFHLYHAHLGNGKKVGNRWIRETARNLAHQQCSEQELAGMCQFSERWLSNFKKRYRINLNRDWSSGNCSSGSPGSTESIGSAKVVTSSADLSLSISKTDETTDNESADSDAESILSDSVETLLDGDDFNNGNNSLSLLGCGTSPATQEYIQEILNKPGQLPIQAFYERFPWLSRKNQMGAEPGRRGRKVQFPGVEKILFERLQQQQSKGERISNRWLQQQARELASQICPEVLQEATKSSRCLFSEHWLHNFKKRYGVTLKQTNRNISNSPKTQEISSPVDAHTNNNFFSIHNNYDTTSKQPPTTITATDFTTVFHLQNWFLTKCYDQKQEATNFTPSISYNATVSTAQTPVWYPTPLKQSLF